MNAQVRNYFNEIEDFRLQVPDAALHRFWLLLGRALAFGEAWDASLLFGSPPDLVSELLDHWVEDFDFRKVEGELNRRGPRRLMRGQEELVFFEHRSREPAAMPLLLLTETLPAVTTLVGPLSDPRRYARSPDVAFHVVYPLALGGGEGDSGAAAASCADLMRELGYTRYLVHGSGYGAEVAQRLAQMDGPRVAAVHATRWVGFPSEDPMELAALSPREKSQLALLAALEHERRENAGWSPLERLAWMLAQLADFSGQVSTFRDHLLTSLTLRELGAQDVPAHRSRSPAPADVSWCNAGSTAPLAVSTFPLDAPTLRRIVEDRQRVIGWTEHDRGGAFPELEQPAVLVAELCAAFAPFR